MGVAFKDLIQGKEISLEDLSGKILVVDTYNLLYQFLSSIRSRDGQLLMDSKGDVTSHLVGIFSRSQRGRKKESNSEQKIKEMIKQGELAIKNNNLEDSRLIYNKIKKAYSLLSKKDKTKKLYSLIINYHKKLI